MNELKLYSFDYIFQLSTALDLVDKQLYWHHPKVAYISYLIGKEKGLKQKEIQNLVFAALVHDIGIFSLKEKRDIIKFDIQGDEKHAFIGSNILEINKKLSQLDDIVRYHHHDWDNGDGKFHNGDIVSELANILYIADRIEILMNKKEKPEKQVTKLESMLRNSYKHKFNPELRNAVFEVIHFEKFYKYINSFKIYNILSNKFNTSDNLIGTEGIINISRLFAYALDFRVKYTHAHSNLVAGLAHKIADKLDYSNKKKINLYIAGLLHDIGKFYIPPEILNKKNELNNKEFNAVKLHPWYTMIILNKVDGFNDISNWASFHHERLDGSGYPFLKDAKNIPEESLLIGVCEIFGTLNEDRSYREKKNKDEITGIMSDMKEHNKLPGKFVDIILDNIDEFMNYTEKVKIKMEKNYKYCTDLE